MAGIAATAAALACLAMPPSSQAGTARPTTPAAALVNGSLVEAFSLAKCADPTIVRDPTVSHPSYYMVCTSEDIPGIPLYHSTNGENWKEVTPNLITQSNAPAWARSSLWGPSLTYVNHQWRLYYTAADSSGLMHIAVATSSSPTGPYVSAPLPVVSSHDGAIDPQAFVASNGRSYLLWKINGNAHDAPSLIQIAPLSSSGTALASAPKTVLRNRLGWEGAVVEGPFMVEHDGTYFLFFCANNYTTSRYAIGVARSTSPKGPFTVDPKPILTSHNGWNGPGGPSITTNAKGVDFLIFAAFRGNRLTPGGRDALEAAISWSRSPWPSIPANATLRAAPAPPVRAGRHL